MLRLVVIYQLVLSLFAGPMLCCCTATRLGYDFGKMAGKTNPISQTPRSCCGGTKSSQSKGDAHSPLNKPEGKHNCPCKNDQVGLDTVVPDAASAGFNLVNETIVHSSHFDCFVGVNHQTTRALISAFDRRTRCAFTPTADLLYVHHVLRC